MIYENAKKILNLNDEFSLETLKKAYYKGALRYHPDKCSDESAGNKFKEINEAYEFMLKYKNIESTEKNEYGYLSLIKRFIRLILPNLDIDDDTLDSSLKNILFKFQKLSFKLFKNIPREDLIKLYTLISNNKDLFSYNPVLMERLMDLIKSNINIDNLIILNPNISDLMNDNVFCLNTPEYELLVPLWHDEIDFDISNCDICIKNIPDLDDNISIDKLNNINITISIPITELLEKDYIFYLGENKFIIPSIELKIIKNQIYTFPKRGMLKINKDNLFDTSLRGDVNVLITLI